MKMTKRNIYILFAVLIAVLSVMLLEVSRRYPIVGRVRVTRFYLLEARACIHQFKEQNGRFPKSISELKEFYRKRYPGHGDRAEYFKEFISCEGNNAKEFDSLNGQGGYYYDPNTGEVRVNLTKPVKHYLRFYFGAARNEIPANW
jgi:hypothetical protein